jgi:uncharacterized protein YutE (UPF0331/DUF86 family)
VVDRDVVLARIATIDRCLQRIAVTRGERRATLLPIEAEDIELLNLQRAVQAAIELATHVVASEGYGLPDSVAASFTLLEREGVLEPELSERLRKMVGFRNIAIHNYQALDPRIVESILTRHLDDLRAFSARIVRHFGL